MCQQLPDSNGFWRDTDGDIWAYDGNPDHQPFILFSNELQEVLDIQPDDQFIWELIKIYAPFTKISNPFPESYYCDCGHIIHDNFDCCPGCGKTNRKQHRMEQRG